MRYIIVWGLVVSLAHSTYILGGQEVTSQVTVQQDVQEVQKDSTAISVQVDQSKKELSSITDICIEHVAQLIAHAKKNRCLSPAHAQQLQGEYSVKTAQTVCEYKIMELADQKTVFLLAKIEAPNFISPSTFSPLAWFSACPKDELADKLRVELDKEFKWSPSHITPDKYTKCTYFSRGNKPMWDINHYVVEIGTLPKETLAALVSAAQQKKEAKESLKNGTYPELHPIVL